MSVLWRRMAAFYGRFGHSLTHSLTRAIAKINAKCRLVLLGLFWPLQLLPFPFLPSGSVRRGLGTEECISRKELPTTSFSLLSWPVPNLGLGRLRSILYRVRVDFVKSRDEFQNLSPLSLSCGAKIERPELVFGGKDRRCSISGQV